MKRAWSFFTGILQPSGQVLHNYNMCKCAYVRACVGVWTLENNNLDL